MMVIVEEAEGDEVVAGVKVLVVDTVVAVEVVVGAIVVDVVAAADVVGVVGVVGVAELPVVDGVGAGATAPTIGEDGEQVVPVEPVAAAGPATVPATACVDCVPLGGAPDVLTKTSLRTSGFCQYFGATSMTT
jgi:hypothetical protein